jgi:hypothetical protein
MLPALPPTARLSAVLRAACPSLAVFRAASATLLAPLP